MAERTYTYTQTNTISYSDVSEKYLIDKREWNRLKDTVSNLHFSINIWEIACSVFGGVFASGLIQWLCIKGQEDYSKLSPVLLTIWIVAIILAIVCLVACIGANKTYKGKVSDIESEISFIEEGLHGPNHKKE